MKIYPQMVDRTEYLLDSLITVAKIMVQIFILIGFLYILPELIFIFVNEVSVTLQITELIELYHQILSPILIVRPLIAFLMISGGLISSFNFIKNKMKYYDKKAKTPLTRKELQKECYCKDCDGHKVIDHYNGNKKVKQWEPCLSKC